MDNNTMPNPNDLKNKVKDTTLEGSGSKGLRILSTVCAVMGWIGVVLGMLTIVVLVAGNDPSVGPMIIGIPTGLTLLITSSLCKAIATIAEAAAIYKKNNNF